VLLIAAVEDYPLVFGCTVAVATEVDSWRSIMMATIGTVEAITLA